jgi:hypothetical protein
MKKLTFFFLSLTCLAAHGQYNQKLSKKAPSLLSYYGSKKADQPATYSPQIRLTYSTGATTTQSQATYTSFNNNGVGPVNATQQGYWSGSKMTTSGLNGRFQAIQSFDLQGNLRESKATYQFSNRKKN